jgi:hypothetical protein
MKEDIETLRAFITGVCTDKGRREARPEATAALDRLAADRDSLRKALDDRWAADLRAAKAIFAQTGRTSGFPSVREVVAFYVAEVERLEKDRDEWKTQAHILRDRCQLVEIALGDHSAKLDRAKEDFGFLLDRLSEYDPDDTSPSRDFYGHVSPAISRAEMAFSELSADAPAPQGAARKTGTDNGSD